MPTRRELRGRLLRMMRAKNPLALYKRFLADTGQSALFKAPAKGVVEWEDAFLVVLCALAFAGPDGFAPTSAVRHLVIDEMQDLTPVQHEAISRLFRCDRTILGDVNQLVDGRAVSVVVGEIGGALVGQLGAEVVQLVVDVEELRGLIGGAGGCQAARNDAAVLDAVDQFLGLGGGQADRLGGRDGLGVGGLRLRGGGVLAGLDAGPVDQRLNFQHRLLR